MFTKTFFFRSALVAAFFVMSMVTATAQTRNMMGNSPVGFGNLYYDDGMVRTVVPPAAAPNKGRDDLFVIDGGVSGQIPIAAVAPGDKGYHGGQWAFHTVMFVEDPYLLTSAYAVHVAETAGDVVVERIPENDFKCPIQP